MDGTALLTICVLLIGTSQQMAVKGAYPDFYEKAEGFTEECIQVSSVKKEEVENLYSDGDFGNSDELKCFMRCILEKTNILNSNGEIQEDAFRASLPDTIEDKKADGIVEKCMKVQSDDACETAFNLAKCCEDEIN